MISGIGISGIYAGLGPGAVSGADRAVLTRESDSRIEATEDRNAGRTPDPVPVKPANIGGGSAIAAQIEAGRQDGARTVEKSPEKSDNDTDAAGLTEEERAQVRKLAARDREVRAHEAAHKAVGGPYAGAASFTFQSGPDGRRYAVGGEVPIDVSAVPGDPDATIRKLRTVRRAALAPAEPSAQDRRVAASAEAGVRAAQADKRAEAAEERSESAPANTLQQPAGPPQTTGAMPGEDTEPGPETIRPENRN